MTDPILEVAGRAVLAEDARLKMESWMVIAVVLETPRVLEAEESVERESVSLAKAAACACEVMSRRFWCDPPTMESLPNPATKVLDPEPPTRVLCWDNPEDPDFRKFDPVPPRRISLPTPPSNVAEPLTAIRLSLPKPAMREEEAPPPKSVLPPLTADPERRVFVPDPARRVDLPMPPTREFTPPPPIRL